MSTLQVSLELGERHSRPLLAGQLRDQQNIVLALLLKNARISAYPGLGRQRRDTAAVTSGLMIPEAPAPSKATSLASN